jgi:malonate transporter and related proteins
LDCRAPAEGALTAVVLTILPVFAVVLAGYAVARAGLISIEGVKGFTNVTFYLFVPALLFRAMRGVHFESINLLPLFTYFGGALLSFVIVMAASRRWMGRGARHATVTALAVTYSNTVLLGIPLVKLAFGDPGLVILLTIVSMHSLFLFATATLFLEFGAGSDDAVAKSHWTNVWEAVRNTLVHPVIPPIIAGLLWGAFRFPLPDAVDAPLALLAAASGPCSLVLLGASLAQYGIAEYWPHGITLGGHPTSDSLAPPAGRVGVRVSKAESGDVLSSRHALNSSRIGSGRINEIFPRAPTHPAHA